MAYVDGFVLPVSKARLDEYKKLAQLARTVWMEYGALNSVECIGDDVPHGELTSFPRSVQLENDEVVVFSWIVYESREARDEINAKVMADPRMVGDINDMPFNAKRMIFGGFVPFLGL